MSEDPFIGQLLAGRYQIRRALGEGGMARVYVALHTGIDRHVAIKVLLPRFVINKKIVRRFMNEGRAAGTIGHPNVVESLDTGETPDGAPFLVLELLEGTTLQGEIEKLGTIPVGRATYIASQIAMAVGAGHAQKIIHRDLKPDNIFLVERGRPDHVKVLDFGISKFMAQTVNDNPEEPTMTKTRQGELLGTPDFMAPEQITDPQSVDGRVDVYSLGVILYELLSGRLPFQEKGLSRMLAAIIADTPPSLAVLCPDLPKELVAVVGRAMEKSPENRQQTMAALEAELQPFVIEPDARRRSSLVPPKRPPEESSARIELAELGGQAQSVRIMPPKRDRGEGHADTLSAASEAVPPSKRSAARRVAVANSLDPMSGATTPSAKPWWPAWAVAIPCVALGLFVWRGVLDGSKQNSSRPTIVPMSTSVARAPDTVDFAVVSTTPGASMTFRGKSEPLPFHREVRKGADPELVEVTAPSHRGRQMWIVLDQPQRLSFDLPRGTGTMRADEDVDAGRGTNAKTD